MAVVLQGLAYWAAARPYRHAPYSVLVFCIEKMVYAVTWFYLAAAEGPHINQRRGGVAPNSHLLRGVWDRRLRVRPLLWVGGIQGFERRSSLQRLSVFRACPVKYTQNGFIEPQK